MHHTIRLLLAEPRSAAVAWAFMLNSMLFANWFARIPAVQRELALSDGALGLTLMGMPLGSAVAMPVVSVLTARLGAGRATILGAALCAAAIAPPGLAGSAWQLFAAMVLLGFGNGAMDVAMNTEAAAVESGRGRSMMAGFHAMWSLGALIGAGIGSLAAATLAPGLHLVLLAAAGLASLPLLRPIARGGRGPQAGWPIFALPSRALVVLAAMAFAAFLIEGAVADWSGVYLRNSLDAPAFMAGIGYAAFSGGMMVGRLTGDGLIDRVGPHRMVAAGSLAAAIALGGALLAAQPWVAVAGFLIAGLGFATVVPVLLRAAARTPGMAPSTSLAGVASTGYAGALSGPALIGLLAEGVTLPVALGSLVLLALAIALASGQVRR